MNAYEILDGLMMVACYIQHEGGYEEYLKLCSTLKEHNIFYTEENNFQNKEILLIIEKTMA